MSDARPSDTAALLLNRLIGTLGLHGDEWILASFSPYCERGTQWGYLLTLYRPGEQQMYEVKVLPR